MYRNQAFVYSIYSAIFLFVIVSASGLCLPAFALSQAGGQAFIGMRPAPRDPLQPVTRSYYVYNSTPGAILHDQLLIANTGTAPGIVDLYGVDATTGATSGTVYEARQEPRRDVGKWLKLATPHLTLTPGEEQVVSFTVTVPRIVRSGQHIGGIVAELGRLKVIMDLRVSVYV